MNEQEKTTGDQNERLDPKIHRDLAKLGWRIPQTEAEVRVAEERAAKLPGEIPARLRETPGQERSHQRGGLLGRYFRDEDQERERNAEKANDNDRSKRDLDRG